MISIRGKDYILFKGRILEDSEASKIYNSYLEMMNEKKQKGINTQMDAKGDPAPGQTSQWKIDETMLLQWNILSITIQKEKDVDKFTIEDWQNVANLVPGRSVQQCQKRWLFIQQIEGKKSSWTAHETEILKRIAAEITQD